MRETTPHPWVQVGTKFVEGESYTGTVTRLEPYGAFVELEPGLEGLVHVSRLGGKGGEGHARELVELGQSLQVRVVQVEAGKRRISLARDADEKTPEERRELEEYLSSRAEPEGFGSLGDFFKKTRKD
jgi:small subunit ribosomal protein S1